MDLSKDLYLNSFYDKENDIFCAIMKDVNNGEKTFYKKSNPQIPIYKAKKDYKHYEEFLHTDDLERHMVSYKWRNFAIARMLGIKDYTTLLKNKKIKGNDVLLNTKIFGSDMDLRDYKIMDYMDSFQYTENEQGCRRYSDIPPIRNIHKSFFDIETDIAVSDDRNKQPIYLITYVDNINKEAHTAYLYNPNYDGIEELRKDPEIVITQLKELINHQIDNLQLSDMKRKNIVQKKCKEIMENFKFHIHEYTDEKTMLISMYQFAFRKRKPDFFFIWNAEYDIGQTMMRAEELGIPLPDLFCCPEMGEYVDFNFADRTFNPAKKRHSYDCASYTKIYDHMILYYAINKASGFSSFNLNDTAMRELGFTKLSYAHVCKHISELPYKDFKLCYMYNVVDVMVMYFMESLLEQTEFLISQRFQKRTEYDNVFGPNRSVDDTFFHIATRHNKIFGPNINKVLFGMKKETIDMLKKAGDTITPTLYELLHKTVKVEGGLCSNPTKFITEHGKKMLSFIPSKVNKYFIDIDAKSMYPYTMVSSNISKSAIWGRLKRIGDRLIRNNKAYPEMLPIINKDILKIGEMYFNIPSQKELLKMICGVKFAKKSSEEFKPMDVDSFIKSYIKDVKLFKEFSKIMKNVITPITKGSKKKEVVEDDDIIENAYKSSTVDDDDNDDKQIAGLYTLSNTPISYSGTRVYYEILDHKNIPIGKDNTYFFMGENDIGDIFIDEKNDIVSVGSKFISAKPMLDIKHDDDSGRYCLSEYYDLLFDKDNVESINMIFNNKYNLKISSRLMIFNNKTHNYIYKKKKKDIAGELDVSILTGGSIHITTNDDIDKTIFSADVNYKIEGKTVKFNNLVNTDKITMSYLGKEMVLNIKYEDIYVDIFKMDVEEDNIYLGRVTFIKPISTSYNVRVTQDMIFVNTYKNT